MSGDRHAIDHFGSLSDEQRDWVVGQCDVALVAEGVIMPVHKLYLTNWSQVLGDCAFSTVAVSSKPSSGTVLPEIPLEATAAVTAAMLKLLYMNIPPQGLEDLFRRDLPCFTGIIRAAHLYHMPMLLEHMDIFLATKAHLKPAQMWVRVDEAIHWATVATEAGLKRLTSRCEAYLMRQALDAVESSSLDNLPSVSLTRILRGSLHIIQHAEVSCLNTHYTMCSTCSVPHKPLFYPALDSRLLDTELKCMLRHGHLPKWLEY